MLRRFDVSALFSLIRILVLGLSAFLRDATNTLFMAADHSIGIFGLERVLGRSVSLCAWGLANALYRLLAYGAMGLLGLCLSFKARFTGVINDGLKRPAGIILTIAAGIMMGIFFVLYDTMHGASIVNVVNAGGLPAIIGLYAPLALVCTYFLKKYGLLSAAVIHVISDLIWRVVYGSV